jgi:hypothetical protein
MKFEKYWARFAVFLVSVVSLSYLTAYGFVLSGDVFLVYVYGVLSVLQGLGFLFGVCLGLVTFGVSVKDFLAAHRGSPVSRYLSQFTGAKEVNEKK